MERCSIPLQHHALSRAPRKSTQGYLHPHHSASAQVKGTSEAPATANAVQIVEGPMRQRWINALQTSDLSSAVEEL